MVWARAKELWDGGRVILAELEELQDGRQVVWAVAKELERLPKFISVSSRHLFGGTRFGAFPLSPERSAVRKAVWDAQERVPPRRSP